MFVKVKLSPLFCEMFVMCHVTILDENIFPYANNKGTKACTSVQSDQFAFVVHLAG